jgi:hypothetical protein
MLLWWLHPTKEDLASAILVLLICAILAVIIVIPINLFTGLGRYGPYTYAVALIAVAAIRDGLRWLVFGLSD